MIVDVNYDEVEKGSLVGVYGGKEHNFLLRVVVNEESVVKAIRQLDLNPSVVAFLYVGVKEFLYDLSNRKKPLIVIENVNELDLNIDFIIQSYPSNVRIVFELPETFSDMGRIHDLSTKYSNVHFCGGHFLRISGCRLGCIVQDDLNKKVPDGKIRLVTDGCASVTKIVKLVDIENVHYVESQSKGVASPVKEQKAPKKNKKNVLKSLFDLD